MPLLLNSQIEAKDNPLVAYLFIYLELGEDETSLKSVWVGIGVMSLLWMRQAIRVAYAFAEPSECWQFGENPTAPTDVNGQGDSSPVGTCKSFFN